MQALLVISEFLPSTATWADIPGRVLVNIYIMVSVS